MAKQSGIEMLLCASVDDGCVKQPRKGSMHNLAASDVDFIQNSTELMEAQKNGVRKFVQGIDVRWLSRDKSIAQMAAFLNLCAAAMILSCGRGLTNVKVEMARNVLSGQGFVEDRRVRFLSKVERNVFLLDRTALYLGRLGHETDSEDCMGSHRRRIRQIQRRVSIVLGWGRLSASKSSLCLEDAALCELPWNLASRVQAGTQGGTGYSR